MLYARTFELMCQEAFWANCGSHVCHAGPCLKPVAKPRAIDKDVTLEVEVVGTLYEPGFVAYLGGSDSSALPSITDH